MRIAITGSHGVGKTTLIKELLDYLNSEASSDGSEVTKYQERKEEKQNNFELLLDAPRMALELGFEINENTPIETELWIFAKQLELEMQREKYYIADKCFIDLLAYAIFIFKDKPEFINILQEIAGNAVKKYDLVIYLPSGEFPIEDDGARSTDPVFQTAIDELVLKTLADFGINYTRITGSIEERKRKAIEIINNYRLTNK